MTTTRTLRVGLTGGIATGKSRVAELLERSGVPVIRADDVGHEVLARDRAVQAAVAARFGRDVLGPDATPDRAALAARVFGDPAARRDLEAILHPVIRAEVQRRLAGAEARGEPVVVVEAALIVEAGWQGAFHRLVVVTCPPEVQVRRLMARDGLGPDAAAARIRAQLPLEAKEAVADHVVRNDGTPEVLANRVEDLLSCLRKDREHIQEPR